MVWEPEQVSQKIASIWVERNYGTVPPVASTIRLHLEESVELQSMGVTGPVYVVFFQMDWDSDAKGLPPRLIVYVDLNSEKVIDIDTGQDEC